MLLRHPHTVSESSGRFIAFRRQGDNGSLIAHPGFDIVSLGCYCETKYLTYCSSGHRMTLKVELTRHARRRMQQRHVTEEEVRQTLLQPDRRASDSYGDPVAFRRFPDRVTVKVAYVVDAGVQVVKTVLCRPERSRGQ